MSVVSGPFEAASEDAARLAELTGRSRHDVAVVLGSGWTAAAEALGGRTIEIPIRQLPNFPTPTVPGHAGRIVSVEVGERAVLVLSGRVHLYEGYSPTQVVHAVRTAILSGCAIAVVTNAAGALRTDLPVGGPVVLADHLNLTGHNPLVGSDPPPPHPTRFCDLTEAYSARLRDVVHAIDPTIREGVYAALLGPSYETPAEIRMLQSLGADLVGMSTALETIAAVHLGAEVLGLALVTNLAAGLHVAPIDHAEVLAAGAEASTRLGTLISEVIGRA